MGSFLTEAGDLNGRGSGRDDVGQLEASDCVAGGCTEFEVECKSGCFADGCAEFEVECESGCFTDAGVEFDAERESGLFTNDGIEFDIEPERFGLCGSGTTGFLECGAGVVEVDADKAGAGRMTVCTITRAACFGGDKMGWLQGGFGSVEYVLPTCIGGITRALYIAF